MSDDEPTLVRSYRIDAGHPVKGDDFSVSELTAENPGAMSPFGDDIEFPLPVERLRYTHPDASARPNLAGA